MIWKFVWRYTGLQRNGRTINRNEKKQMRHKKYWYAASIYIYIWLESHIRDVKWISSSIIVERLSKELCLIDERIDHLEIRPFFFFLFLENSRIFVPRKTKRIRWKTINARGRRSRPIILMKNIYMYLWTHWKMDSRWRIGKHAARSWLNDPS